MSYSDIINNTDFFEENYLCVLSPRRVISHVAFSLVSGSTYKATFDYGFVSKLAIDGVSLTEAASTSLTSGQWYWDYLNNEIYVRKGDDTAPDSNDFIVLTYELYFSTQDFQWYRDPLDTSSPDTSYQPFLVRAPSTKQTFQDLLQGFSPTTISGLQLDNHEHTLEKHLYDSSFFRAKVEGYHIVGDVGQLDVANIKKVFVGFIESHSYDQSEVSFRVADITQELNVEMRSSQTGFSDFLGTTEFPTLDVTYDGQPKRRIFGKVRQIQLLNVNYSSTISASTNNEFLVARKIDMQGSDAAGVRGVIDFTSEIDTGTTGAGLVTRIYFTDADFVNNFTIGEEIIVYPSSHVWADPPATDYNSYRTTITAIGANYIDIGTARDVTGVNQISARMQVPVMWAIQDQTVTQLHPFRDYYIDVEQDMFKVVLDSGYVASSGVPSAISDIDVVVANVYGYNTGDSSSWAQVTTNGARLIKYFLSDLLGVEASRINSTSFSNFESSYDEILGFSIPSELGSYVTFKQIITEILISIRARMYIDNDLKYSLARIDYIGAIDDTATDDDFVINRFSMDTDYSDVVDAVRVNFNKAEVSLNPNQFTGGSDVVTATSNTGRYLHGVTSEMVVDSFHVLTSEASSFATFLVNIYGDRNCEFEVNLAKRFFDSLISDNIRIEREKLPGFDYAEGTLRQRDTKVISVEKGINSIKLILNDQKGIEDN